MTKRMLELDLAEDLIDTLERIAAYQGRTIDDVNTTVGIYVQRFADLLDVKYEEGQ